ncbi:uncharacterized protein PV09_03432 [Verruconis gallopava]|uniref:Uncharacterized protein n=1 Tax=Verruconis gallopava TaxID=253628 RepID=A0A0D2B2Q8_9PEZI|nr:uncharacterized protein PV09_03432 [Verruconis gallopava]KIW05554.1 hypothetical protein PV09_03432 [Verruconis gallopava]
MPPAEGGRPYRDIKTASSLRASVKPTASSVFRMAYDFAEKGRGMMGWPSDIKLPSPRPQLPRRRSYRNFLIICIVGLLWIFSYRHYEWVKSTNIPILGARPSELHGYFPPIGNNFLPKVADYNVYRRTHPRTPLFIPFTRNNSMLRQAVLSYIAAGWPRNDIVIVDNTGVMDSNERHLLAEDNPFFLDYDLFRRRYGVSILQTPTLFNFAQLQNFFLRTAIARQWPFYFWSHMDIAVLSGEDLQPFKSFYHRVIDVLDSVGLDQYSTLPPTPEQEAGKEEPKSRRSLTEMARRKQKELKWAIKFFEFDNLALINVEAWKKIGSWDVFIPYYNTDCDAYARVLMNGYTKDEVQAGYIFDVADLVEDPEIRFFPAETEKDRKKWGLSPSGPEPYGGEVNSARFQWLKSELQEMMDVKNTNELGRNTWQGASADRRPPRHPEPWSHSPKDFQASWWAAADAGRAIYIKKWGTLQCDLTENNRTLQHVWFQEHVQEESPEWVARMQEMEHWNGILNEAAIR